MLRLDLAAERKAELDAMFGGLQDVVEDEESCSDDAAAAGKRVKMAFSLPGGPTATHYLERVPVGVPSVEDASSFTFDTQLEQGVVGPVFAGTLVSGGDAQCRGLGMGRRIRAAPVPVVAKVALHAAETVLLMHEAAMYARAARLQGGVLPEVYGVFETRARTRQCGEEEQRRGRGTGRGEFMVFVMEHRGARVGDLGALSWGQRVSLYISLTLLHVHGVQHGDLRADNVVVSPAGVPSFIDLSHARPHACKGDGHGEEGCAELAEGPSSKACMRVG
ncbi:hypothetical protein K438DRAFT_1961678 [Mycena galopus ATCC 62051]|nr:hypothetical protein K438DRAFT_1961678 [Mycena galopus ATCC 62051]